MDWLQTAANFGSSAFFAALLIFKVLPDFLKTVREKDAKTIALVCKIVDGCADEKDGLHKMYADREAKSQQREDIRRARESDRFHRLEEEIRAMKEERPSRNLPRGDEGDAAPAKRGVP